MKISLLKFAVLATALFIGTFQASAQTDTLDSRPSVSMPEVNDLVSDTALTVNGTLSEAIDSLVLQESVSEPPEAAEARKSHRQRVREKDSLIMADITLNSSDFTPIPRKATIMSMLIPGGGQIYNRKYWKLPIVYGGYVGCIYALTWNNQTYKDYMQAYVDIMDDDPTTVSYEDFLPPKYDIESNKSWLQTVLKNRKDRYRRYRDLSIFSFAGVYVVSIIDAYVDAELSHFDISRDLSLRIHPDVVDWSRASLGLNFTFSF